MFVCFLINLFIIIIVIFVGIQHSGVGFPPITTSTTMLIIQISKLSLLWIMYVILIIHASECISGSATCIEDIYNDANRTSGGGGGGGPASSVCITLWMSEIMLQLR